jgi:thiamine-phosphate pyrophosphorylase
VAARLNAASARPGLLPPLVLMTDDERLSDPCAAAALLPRGSMVIVRARVAARRAALVLTLAPIARLRGLILLVAGDMLPGADGIHLSEARTSEAPHWRARFAHAVITASAHSPAALARAQTFGVDAVFLSAIFATQSHPGRAALTPLRAGLMARQMRLPVYALGGIESRNGQRLAGMAFTGLAAIGALAP